MDTDGDAGKGRRSAVNGGAGVYRVPLSQTAPGGAAWRSGENELPSTSTAPSSYVSAICRKISWGFLLPFLPGMALAVFGSAFESRPTSQLIAIIVLGVALFLGVAWWNAHTARKLQNEIDTLDVS